MLNQAVLLGAVLGVSALEAPERLPEAFTRIPAGVRAKATVVVVGVFTSGRGPCEFLPDGSRRWFLLRGFNPVTVYRGTVRADYIGIADPVASAPTGETVNLVEGKQYLLLLRPSKSSAKMLERREGARNYRDTLRPEEVVAIVAY